MLAKSFGLGGIYETKMEFLMLSASFMYVGLSSHIRVRILWHLEKQSVS